MAAIKESIFRESKVDLKTKVESVAKLYDLSNIINSQIEQHFWIIELKKETFSEKEIPKIVQKTKFNHNYVKESNKSSNSSGTESDSASDAAEKVFEK